MLVIIWNGQHLWLHKKTLTNRKLASSPSLSPPSDSTPESYWQKERQLKVMFHNSMHHLYLHSEDALHHYHNYQTARTAYHQHKLQFFNMPCLNFLFTLLLMLDHSLTLHHSNSKMRGWRRFRGIHFLFVCFSVLQTCLNEVLRTEHEVLLQRENYFSSKA